MPVAVRALWRGTRTLSIAVLGLAAATAAHLWWDMTAAALLAIAGFFCAAIALGLLYDTRRPLRFRWAPLTLGYLALLVLYVGGVVTARDVALTLFGDDIDAVVARTWTTHDGKGNKQYHCALQHTDGTPIRRELATNCEGHERGETIPVVLDRAGRFAPISGPKSDMHTAGEIQATGIAALVLLTTIAIGTPPKRKKEARR